MRQIQILIDFAKNGTDRHQMDQMMVKTECSVKNQNFVFFLMAWGTASPVESRRTKDNSGGQWWTTVVDNSGQRGDSNPDRSDNHLGTAGLVNSTLNRFVFLVL